MVSRKGPVENRISISQKAVVEELSSLNAEGTPRLDLNISHDIRIVGTSPRFSRASIQVVANINDVV
jgi:hypothetical protein